MLLRLVSDNHHCLFHITRWKWSIFLLSSLMMQSHDLLLQPLFSHDRMTYILYFHSSWWHIDDLPFFLQLLLMLILCWYNPLHLKQNSYLKHKLQIPQTKHLDFYCSWSCWSLYLRIRTLYFLASWRGR